VAHLVVDDEKARALAALAESMGAVGEHDRAERFAGAIEVRKGEMRDRYPKSRARTDLAWQAVISGDHDRAGRLIRGAYAAARGITSPYSQARLLLEWARVQATRGDRSKADDLAGRAVALATEKLNEPTRSDWVLEALPLIVTGTGDLDAAEALARTVPDPYHQARAAAKLAVMVAVGAETRRAEALLKAITDEYRRTRLSDALAAIGILAPCAAVDPYKRARALASLAEVVAAGGPGHAWSVSDWAEPLVRYSEDRDEQKLMFAVLAAGATGGNGEWAEALAGRADAIVQPIADAENQPQALVSLAQIVADGGALRAAIDLAGAAEALVRYTERYVQTWRVADLADMAYRAARDGPHSLRHAGPCTDQPGYVPARNAAFELTLRDGDVRWDREGLSGHDSTCCGQLGIRDGERDGQHAWIERRAVEIRDASRGILRRLSMEQARAKARSELAGIERAMDGWG
jgi:hypothetical protein